MKKKLAKLVSSTVLSIAERSSSVISDWRLYQPKVPQKLLDKKGKD
ncbi:MAG: cyclic lactone autoinducer peptide [Clostridiales Family XIII bacterium]|nr:cyclic lactone autoinducer peptide [Clostridiales Family XIII bacterium]